MASHTYSKEAHSRATTKYRRNHYYQVAVGFPIEEREMIKAHAEKRGVPVATLLKNLFYADMEKG